MEKRDQIKKAFIDTIPVMAGYIVLGIGFGVVLKTKGYGVGWALFMSVFIFAGSMQFVAINLFTAGASFLTTALTTLLVNARHLFYGISMIDKYKNIGKTKPYLIFGLSDETYSLVSSKDEDQTYYFAVTLMDQSYWVLGSVIGSLLGSVLPFDSTGIDFSLTALFVTIVVDQFRQNKDHIPVYIGIGLSVICLLIFGSDNFLIPSMIAIMTALFIVRKKEEPKYE